MIDIKKIISNAERQTRFKFFYAGWNGEKTMNDTMISSNIEYSDINYMEFMNSYMEGKLAKEKSKTTKDVVIKENLQFA